jgi:hypothetical protein
LRDEHPVPRRCRCRRIRSEREKAAKRTQWDWQDKRNRAKRTRARRKHRREKLFVHEEHEKMSKAMGRDLPPDDGGSGTSDASSEFERKGVTLPKKHLRLDYGHPPDHPVNRGAAPHRDEHGKISFIRVNKWTGFGVERPPRTFFKYKAYVAGA